MKYKFSILILGLVTMFTTACDTEEDNNTPPENPIISIYSFGTCKELRPTLSWTCWDEDGDELTYTINFGSSVDNLETIASNLATTEYTFSEELEVSTTYYWQVIASDGKAESISDMSLFSTVGDPIDNTVPSTPVIVSPKYDTQAGDIEFIWSTVVDDGGLENITYILNVNGETYELTESTIKILNLSACNCTWYVTAFDAEGNGSESEHISIKIIN